MIETKPSPDSKPPRKPEPTPAPRLFAPANLPSSEPSSEDPLDALVADQRAGETWIKLTPVHVIRAADLREIEETPRTTRTEKNADWEDVVYEWPVKALVINGQPVMHPHWTLEELLAEIGVEVREPPETRTWKLRDSTPEQTKSENKPETE